MQKNASIDTTLLCVWKYNDLSFQLHESMRETLEMSSTMLKNTCFLTNKFFGLIKIELNIQLKCLLFIIIHLDEAQIVTMTGISKPTLIKFKDAFSLKIKDEYCDNIKK
ncbi:hypothetical protein CDIK_4519 [Cucumispora dikerogammari]|nr:hypothetical protein CDIK_4519 [Cucumispora dikerogammari]